MIRSDNGGRPLLSKGSLPYVRQVGGLPSFVADFIMRCGASPEGQSHGDQKAVYKRAT
jgi:hypothetical protein